MVRAFAPDVDAGPLAAHGVYAAAALSADACLAVRAAMDAGSASPAEVAEGGYLANRRVRDAQDIDISPAGLAVVERAVSLSMPAIADRFGMSLSGREGTGLVRYGAGVGYRRHRDVGAGVPRVISVVLFLNSAGEGVFEGGALRFYDQDEPLFEITPTAGALVAFAASRVHEVRPITFGIRDVAVDWLY